MGDRRQCADHQGDIAIRTQSPSTNDVRSLYERRIDSYSAFIRFFGTHRGLQSLLERSDLLRPHMKVLDAGCGFGTATFALLDALRAQNIAPGPIDAFDLTPAMLARFRDALATRADSPQVELREAEIRDRNIWYVANKWCLLQKKMYLLIHPINRGCHKEVT